VRPQNGCGSAAGTFDLPEGSIYPALHRLAGNGSHPVTFVLALRAARNAQEPSGQPPRCSTIGCQGRAAAGSAIRRWVCAR
jgi:hypothetical protein